MKHKHADLIHAWADGAEIQEWQEHLQVWETDKNPTWHPDSIYRIKPKPKHDVVAYLSKEFHSTLNGFAWHESTYQFHTSLLKITFDGETGKLKSAEVIK